MDEHVTDTLIVGQGIAGTYVSYFLEKAGVDHMVLDAEHEGTSSKIAAGICNPVTGKRVVLTWKGKELFDFAHSFYLELEEHLGTTFFQKKKIFRVFHDIAYQNDFLPKLHEPAFAPFLDETMKPTSVSGQIKEELGGMGIRMGGWCNTWELVQSYRSRLMEENRYLTGGFNHDQLERLEEGFRWNTLRCKRIIFCEGPEARNNPFFSWLPFSVTKGELLKLKIPAFETDFILNKGVFLFNLKDDLFLAGSTFSHDLAPGPTENKKEQLLEKLDKLLDVPYTIVEQPFGIRPTIRDRRPLIGQHPKFPGMFIFNGLGTKGVTLGPYFANQFVGHLLNEEELDPEVNIERFFSLFEKQR